MDAFGRSCGRTALAVSHRKGVSSILCQGHHRGRNVANTIVPSVGGIGRCTATHRGIYCGAATLTQFRIGN